MDRPENLRPIVIDTIRRIPMRLAAIDQVSVTSVKADSLRPGEEFTVSDAYGEDLITKHPDKFRKVADDQPEAKEMPAPIAKAEPAPLNKAEDAPANKADHHKRKGK
jgi:hypothetical protein